MEQVILKWVPNNWDKSAMSNLSSWCCQVNLEKSSEEFKQIQYEIRKALGNSNKEIRTIERNQSIYDLGQVLIREQLLLTIDRWTTYYRVRRFVKIRAIYLKAALTDNIDHRRCGNPESPLIFQSNIPDATSDDILLVIQVITSNPHTSDIKPTSSSDYYIEYIVKF